MRRLPLGLLTCLLAVLALTGCGSGGGSGSAPDPAASGPDPATIAPPNAAAYGEVLVRPRGEVQSGIEAAARKVTRMHDPFGALRARLDEALHAGGASYARNVEPWLGDRVGAFLLLPRDAHARPDVGVIVAARNRATLRRELDRLRPSGHRRDGATYRGVHYLLDEHERAPAGVVDGFLVGATSMRAFRAAVDASRGASLGDSSRYRDALGTLDADRLALLYADPQQIAAQVHAMRDVPADVEGILKALHLTGGPPVTASLTARADEIAIELVAGSDVLSQSDTTTGAVSLEDLPADAWLALATPPLGPLVRQLLDETGVHDRAAARVREATGLDLDRDLLDPLGGLAGFARGTGPLDIGGGVALRMRDAASARALLTRLQALVTTAADGAARPLSGGGFELRVPPAPQPVIVQAHDDRIAAGYGSASVRDLLHPQQRFTDSAAGKAAIATLGEGYTPSLVLIVPPLVQLLRSLDDIQLADFSKVLPYLRPYRSLALGTRRDDDRTTVRIVAALK